MDIMHIKMIVLIAAAVIVCFSLYRLYVAVILKKNKVQEAFSSINVQLKKRYDLIPNILTIASKFMEHEKSLMSEITELRSQAMKLAGTLNNADEKLKLDTVIQGKMGQLLVSVENYPQLKSDQTMMTAMQTYNEVEEHIAAARRFYNSAVLELNNAVEIFPSSVIAAMLGISKKEFFEVDEAETKPINASDYLK